MRLLLPGDGWIRATAILAALGTAAASEPLLGAWSLLLAMAAYFLVRGIGRFFRERAFLRAQIRRMTADIHTDL